LIASTKKDKGKGYCWQRTKKTQEWSKAAGEKGKTDGLQEEGSEPKKKRCQNTENRGSGGKTPCHQSNAPGSGQVQRA